MKHCPNCNSTYSDTVKFCTKCGTKLEDSVACPECGHPLKHGTKFCTNCGAKLDDTKHPQVSPVTPVVNSSVPKYTQPDEIATSNSSVYEYEIEETFFQKNKNALIIMAITAVIVAAIVGFSMFHGQNDGDICMSDAVDTAAVDTVAIDEEESLPKEIFEFESVETSPDVLVCEFTSTVEGKKEPDPYAENDEVNYGNNHRTFEKGEKYFCYGKDAIDYNIEKKSKDWSLFTSHGTGEISQWYIPSSSYKAAKYKQAKIPVSILNDYRLIFQSNNGDKLTLLNLHKNQYSIKDHDDNDQEINYSDPDFQYCIFKYTKSENSLSGWFIQLKGEYIDLEKTFWQGYFFEKMEAFDADYNLISDVPISSSLIEDNCAYIPSEKSLFVNDEKYKFIKGVLNVSLSDDGDNNEIKSTREREGKKREVPKNIKPFIGVWTKSIRNEKGLAIMYLTIREDGSAKFEMIDRGVDGLLMRPVFSLSFDNVQISGNSLLLLKNGSTLSKTPSVKIVGNTIEDFTKQK